MHILLSIIALAAAWALLLQGVDPVPTWFYVFAWYPTLTLLDGVAVRLDGRPSILARPALAVSLLGWSPIIWLAFEAANFRLENWYYVFLPANPVERWAGIVLSFATVMPAIVLSERVLAAAGVFRGGRARPGTIRPSALRAASGLALAALAVSLVWPRLFFPLVWGVGLFLCEPLVYRRAPAMSLFRDVERGDWGRIGRLLLGGLGIGLLWECYNHWAEGSWIYTVPGLEHLKLFEMPPLGFLGFPIFALSGWSMYGALCAAGVARPVAGPGTGRPGRTVAAAAIAVGFAAAVLWGMEHFTISSTMPRLVDLPGVTPSDRRAIENAGITTVRALARQEAAALARAAALDSARADEAVQAARLVMLRGLGPRHAAALHGLGIRSPCELAGLDPVALAERLQDGGRRPTVAEVRVWRRGAATGGCRPRVAGSGR